MKLGLLMSDRAGNEQRVGSVFVCYQKSVCLCFRTTSLCHISPTPAVTPPPPPPPPRRLLLPLCRPALRPHLLCTLPRRAPDSRNSPTLQVPTQNICLYCVNNSENVPNLIIPQNLFHRISNNNCLMLKLC